MSIFQEYDSVISHDYDILFRQFEIDTSRLDNVLITESSISDMEEAIFSEAETLNISDLTDTSSKPKKSKGRFMETLTAIANRITKFITDVIDMISNMFSGSSHIDIEAYLNSSTGVIEMDRDIKLVNKQVKEEIRKGRKLIRSISKGTGIDEGKINDYVDNAAKGIQKHGKVVLKTASSYIQLKHATGDLKYLKNEMINALTDCKDALGDPTKEMQVAKVYKSMRHWTSEGTYAYNMFCKNIYNEALKQQKEQEKKNKKNNKGGQK